MPVTGYSGLVNGHHGLNEYDLLSSNVATGNVGTRIARLLAKRLYGYGAKAEVLRTLVEGNVGDTAVSSHKRVKAESTLEADLNGARPIETVEHINRATTAEDIAQLIKELTLSSQPASYVADRSGNGGGGKVGV